ncbi:uncharacterized protein KY384_005985 [Bacidia gigantensis]|uniref:uncharacterized protein n=1 Tax=Bacidia gigantensis TaxID=2732470 RepID=UPI001D04F0FB|nr:uncharacterized protein KY384_005985 [Bacidia gigantensis]KAG8529349.1 hypothetical protein KY384_005985 [Bacidia gigantensis]
MGLLTDYLRTSPKQRKAVQRKHTTKAKTIDDKSPTTMTSETHYMTLDGECPNGGVPTGTLFLPVEDVDLEELPPNGGIPPEDTLHGPPAIYASHLNNQVTQQLMCGGFNIYNHHYHGNGHGQTRIRDAQTPRTPPKTYIRFIEEGIRPCDVYLDADYDNIPSALLTFDKTTTIEQFLQKVGCPARRGNGVQQVFPMRHQRWGAGQIFKWGIGDRSQTLEGSELAKGECGREVWLCSWTE